MKHHSSFDLFQRTKKVKTVLENKNGVGLIWLGDSTLATSDLDKHEDHIMRKIFRFGLEENNLFNI